MFIRSVADVTQPVVDEILAEAEAQRIGAATIARPGALVGLVFLDASLRTRVGFATAAARLGATTVEVLDTRHSPVSMPESLGDTLRTVGGYVDTLVVRANEELVCPDGLGIPLINGGDQGPSAEHPTQALVDLFALRQLPIPVAEQVVAICGDLRMRSVRSLLGLLARTPPRKLLLVTTPRLKDGFTLPGVLNAITEHRTLTRLEDADVLYVAGIPHGALDEAGRTALRVTPTIVGALKSSAVILSPLPVIDEIATDAYRDHRIRMFQQSDDGLYVRMAILKFALDQRNL